jgi:hypothetical protein
MNNLANSDRHKWPDCIRQRLLRVSGKDRVDPI